MEYLKGANVSAPRSLSNPRNLKIATEIVLFIVSVAGTHVPDGAQYVVHFWDRAEDIVDSGYSEWRSNQTVAAFKKTFADRLRSVAHDLSPRLIVIADELYLHVCTCFSDGDDRTDVLQFTHFNVSSIARKREAGVKRSRTSKPLTQPFKTQYLLMVSRKYYEPVARYGREFEDDTQQVVSSADWGRRALFGEGLFPYVHTVTRSDGSLVHVHFAPPTANQTIINARTMRWKYIYSTGLHPPTSGGTQIEYHPIPTSRYSKEKRCVVWYGVDWWADLVHGLQGDSLIVSTLAFCAQWSAYAWSFVPPLGPVEANSLISNKWLNAHGGSDHVGRATELLVHAKTMFSFNKSIHS